jgi:hypothetical protein
VGTIILGVREMYHEADDLPLTCPHVLMLQHRNNFTFNLVVDRWKLGKANLIAVSTMGE